LYYFPSISCDILRLTLKCPLYFKTYDTAKGREKNTSTDFENIPIATKVEIIGDVESNTLQPANNPHHTSGLALVPATNAVVVTTNTIIGSRAKLRLDRQPCKLICPHCHKETITIVEDRIGMGTILATILIAIVFWPLCWLPLCCSSCKQTVHFCGLDSCRRKIGVTEECA